MTVLAANLDLAAPACDPVATRGLCMSIDERPILLDINLTIAPRQFVALLGANGAGKSSLLKVLSTLSPPTSGELLLFGRSLQRESAAIRQRIGLISHQSMLYRDLTAFENLVFFGKLYNVEKAEGRADELLAAVDLVDRADDPVKTYSRGMTQRLAIARALMHNPDLLLADEPFDGLDAPSAQALEQLLARLHQAGKTIILANHDIPQSLRLTQRAIVLRQGRIVIDRHSAALDAGQILGEMQARTPQPQPQPQVLP